MNRTDKSIKNLLFAFLSQGVTVLLSFMLRTEMLRSLGILPASLNSLFTDVISTLSLAELGVGSAIVYIISISRSRKGMKRRSASSCTSIRKRI